MILILCDDVQVFTALNGATLALLCGAGSMLAGLAGCSAAANQPVAIVLDIPNGPLEPKGAATVEITLNSITSNDAVIRTANVSASGAFDIGEMPKNQAGRIEAALRSESGALIGYGRSVEVVRFDQGGTATVPVRRPMLYLGSGTSVFKADANDNPVTNSWATRPAVVADLSPDATAIGTSPRLATNAGYLVAAAGTIYGLQQNIDSDGRGNSAVTLVELRSEDHTPGPARPIAVTGDIREAAGSDDGQEIAVATSDGAWLVHVASGTTDRLATGAYDRITLRDVGADSTQHEVFALSGRVADYSNCTAVAKLERVTITTDTPNKTLIAMGAISDISTANGRIFFSNVCTGKISEITATGTVEVRVTGGHPTNLVASDTQMWFSEVRGTIDRSFAVSSLVLSSNDPPRLLWQTPATLLLLTSVIEGVQRTLKPNTAEMDELTLVSNEFIALRTRMTFDVPRPDFTNLPRTAAQTDSAWIISAAGGGVVSNYQSWCKVLTACGGSDLCGWSCADAAGSSRPASGNEHRLRSLAATFQRR